MLTTGSIRRIHFIGICGTGMASLAAMLQEKGYEVTGSDEGIYPPMSGFLEERRIRVSPRYAIENLQPEPDLVVVGNALSRGNPEVEYILNFKLRYASFPETLEEFFLRGRSPLVVTGTHGKTTTTSMIAWVLRSAGFDPSLLVGGIAENFGASYALGAGPHFVVEGDEYDSAFFDKGPKFLHYLPEVAVVGNVEFDHADIYPSLEAVRTAFARFVNLIPERGFVAVGIDSPAAAEVCRRTFCLKETFALDAPADWGARRIEAGAERTSFDLLYQGKLFRRIELPLLGRYNVRNALAAAAVLHHVGVPEDDIRAGLESFRGVRRRLELRAEVEGVRIYEDFAHHPTAVRETIAAVREHLRPARLWAIWEPRSATSRRNIFQTEMAEALAGADFALFPPLFRPEKVPDGERFDLERLAADLERAGGRAWHLPDVERIIRKVCEEARAEDLVLILSNGSFENIYERLPAALRQR
jgi:UDP-N-acetylmuramate: L-alanyl-gamma-D-glutamyl-meso-diaminopimelate ligase